ncbi:hypothetical protein PINS_up002132 [Pythium insidiosum]|nr:hypothetical protein PINS_up002132 [Pythium insidiosum]
MGKTPTPLTRAYYLVAPVQSPSVSVATKRKLSHLLSQSAVDRDITATARERAVSDDIMPRRKRRNTRPLRLEAPALSLQNSKISTVNGHSDDEGASSDDQKVVFKVNGSPIVSPRSIRNSLAETDFDMEGNRRTRKGSVSINYPSKVSSASDEQVVLVRHSEQNAAGKGSSEKRLALGPDRPPQPQSVNSSGSSTPRTTPGSDDSQQETQLAIPDSSEGALAGLSGAQLWVHRVLSTHHQTLHTLGIERQDFPNTRLSLKQLEVLLSPVISLCNRMTPAQFGIRAPTPSIASTMTEVHYWKLWESDTIDMGIFFMPPNSVIPLHNHPGMSVVSRILYGGASVTSYDLVPKTELLSSLPASEVEAEKDDVKWARVTREGDYVGESTMWLDPRRFNLHHIQANPEIGCALLDIMIPPYDNADRDCHHFKIIAEKILEHTQRKLFKMLESVQPDNHNEPSGGFAQT